MSRKAKQGDLVLIHRVILSPEQRPSHLPESTKAVPYEMWIKGFLLDEEATIDQTVHIETFIGRELSGTLVEINPTYEHNFGTPPRQLIVSALKCKEKLNKREEMSIG